MVWARSMGTSRIRQVCSAAQTLVRVGLCGVVVYLGYVTIRGVATLLETDPVQEPTIAKPASDSIDPGPASLLAEDGYWRFAGWGWELKRTAGTLDDLTLVPSAACDKPEGIAPDEARFLELLTMLKATKLSANGFTTYTLELRPGRLMVSAVSDGTDAWIEQAMVGTPTGDHGQWQILRVRRRSEMLGESDPAGLIPLGDLGRRIVARVDDGGRLQAELLEGCPPLVTLRPSLERIGYSFRLLDSVAGFQQRWLVSKGSQALVMWEPSVQGSGVLLLSRLDVAAEDAASHSAR